MNSPDTRRPSALVLFLTLCTLLALVEASCYFVVSVLASKDAVYRPLAPRGVAEYLQVRDPLLGWPSPRAFGIEPLDSSGARLLPAFPAPGQACVSAYGDSFVFGDEVAAADAWSNQLALRLGCRVANYGVNGYGTDQAYLRFQALPGDESSYAVLGVFTNDIVRNVNQLRNLLAPAHEVGLKPRFDIDEHGALYLLPLPSFPTDQLEDVIRRPEHYLKDDYFVPGGPAGVVRASFPYSLTIVRALWSYKLNAVIQNESPYADFYAEQHPSRALPITLGICQKFIEEATTRNKSALVVMFPSRNDLEAFATQGRWIYQSLIDALTQEGGAVLNLGPHLLAGLRGREPAALFKHLHYNEEGNRLVAQALAQALRALPDRKQTYPPGIPAAATARP